MTKYETIQKYCKIRGTSVAKMERDLNFARGSIAKIDEHKPSADKIWRICDYLRMPMNLLMDINEEQRGLMEQFDELTEKPLYRASAGQGAYNDTYADETISTEEDGYEYATVIGDSMLPELKTGDVVKIKPQAETTPHDLTLVKVDGEHATIMYPHIPSCRSIFKALNGVKLCKPYGRKDTNVAHFLKNCNNPATRNRHYFSTYLNLACGKLTPTQFRLTCEVIFLYNNECLICY